MHEDLLTALDDERMDEEPIKFKYPEHEETTKKMEEIFYEDLKNCTKITEAYYNERKAGVRMKEKVSLMLSPFL